MPDRVVISNTSPLLYLHQVGKLELLRDLYREILVPTSVETELRRGVAIGVVCPDLRQHEWIQVRSPFEKARLRLVVALGQGEADVIALGNANPGSLLILDDSRGRKVATAAGLVTTGTLGVLVKATQRGLLTELEEVLQSLGKTSMYLSPPLIAAVMKKARGGGREPGEV